MLADMVLTSLNLKGKVKSKYVDYDRRRSLEIEVFKRIADTTKAETLLAYRPLTGLESGLQKYIAWYKNRK
jgi:nucleoside-diphosphate-sugar epimerase